ncbi:MAG: alanine racemase [Clostridia bacterium]|nr:alanine racemase [Clostridia bacterium]
MNHFLKRAWAEIDLDALEHNFIEIKKCIKDAKLLCVIKADAYGHGATVLAKEYERMGADYFAVSNLDEALQLRHNGITLPILILGYTPEEEAATLANNNISQAVYSLDYAVRLSQYAVTQGVSVKIHLKLDTGMTRIGLLCQTTTQISSAVDDAFKICTLDGLHPDGVFTHFALADEGDCGAEYTQKQFECFTTAINMIEAHGIKFNIRHCANSAAILDYPSMHLDMVRAGIILYGLSSDKINNKIPLRPVMCVKAVVSHVKEVPAGSLVGYGCTFKSDRPIKIATIPIGYADGLSRHLGNKGYIYINEQNAMILGRVCMDQIMVDVTNISDVKRGDTVTIFGDNNISCDDIARLCDTINYEIVCLVGKRVPRVYIKGKKISEVMGLI